MRNCAALLLGAWTRFQNEHGRFDLMTEQFFD